jgi:hypothetical protein
LGRLRHKHLDLCPIVSSSAEAAAMEKKLRQLFAEERFKDHFKKFLPPGIPITSRTMNDVDIQSHLNTLRDGWVRSSPSDLGLSAKADADRVSIYTIKIFSRSM